MEAEEAKRLKDEAIRLAQQAKILELEAQRPLLEAQRLDAEIRLMEQQFGKIFGEGGLLKGGSSGQMTAGSSAGSGGLGALYGDGQGGQASFGGIEVDTFMQNARKEVQ